MGQVRGEHEARPGWLEAKLGELEAGQVAHEAGLGGT